MQDDSVQAPSDQRTRNELERIDPAENASDYSVVLHKNSGINVT